MGTTRDKTFKPRLITNRRYKVNTMHLFDTKAREEKPLCGADVPIIDLIGVDYYLERRAEGLPVGVVCEDCKAELVRLVENRCHELKADAGLCLAKAERLRKRDAVRYRNSVEAAEMEAGRLLHRAEEYRGLADELARETGPNRNGG